MKTIVCGLWKEPEHDYIGDIISWLLKISRQACKGDFPFLSSTKGFVYERSELNGTNKRKNNDTV